MPLYIVVLLVRIALALSLALGVSPALAQSSSASTLPATQPGLTRDEGVFLITAADDGSRAAYFIAQNTRHSIAAGDLQLEQQLNPLRPVRSATRDEVLAFPETAPIGGAKTGLITVPIEPVEDIASPVADETPAAAAEAQSPVAEDMASPVADETPAAADDAPSGHARARGEHASVQPDAACTGDHPAAYRAPGRTGSQCRRSAANDIRRANHLRCANR